MNDRNDVAAVLAEAVLLDSSPQADALGAAVAEHIASRPERVVPAEPDPAVLELLRKEKP